jgi:hypothetical protein
MVAMMAQEAIEKLTQEDLGDLRECISNRWVFSDESRPERLPGMKVWIGPTFTI